MPMRFIGGPGRGDILNNLVPQSLLENAFYLMTTFQHTNGFLFGVTGTGAFAVTSGRAVLNTGATNLSTANAIKYFLPTTHLAFFSWDRERVMRCAVQFQQNTNQTHHLICGSLTLPNSNGAGFRIVNNQIFGILNNAAGVTTLTAALLNFNAGDEFILKIHFKPGIECRFFIDDVDVGVLTTGLPFGVGDASEIMNAAIQNTAAANKEVDIDFWEFYQAR